MLFNTGFYSPGEAAALLHEDARTVRRWAFGYRRNRQSGRVQHPPLIRTELPDIEGERALTFVELVELGGHGQQAFPQVLKPYLEQLEFGVDGVAARWWPMGKHAGVLVDPRIAFGAPIIEDTRIPASTLAEAFEAEQPVYGERAVERVAWMYEVEPRQVESVLGFSRWLRRA